MKKIESMPLNVVLQLAKAELMSAYRTDKVEIIGVGFDPDVCESDEEGEHSLMVTACIMPEEECFKKDCGTHPWVMTWDEDTCDFCSIMRWDQDEDGDNEHLPENIVERCKYVGLTMDAANLNHCNVDVNAELKVPVTMVRWNYPFEVKEGSYNVYPVEEAHTWGELLDSVKKVFQREYAADERTHFHALGDYIIEPLEIHPNNLATVYFGS